MTETLLSADESVSAATQGNGGGLLFVDALRVAVTIMVIARGVGA